MRRDVDSESTSDFIYRTQSLNNYYLFLKAVDEVDF